MAFMSLMKRMAIVPAILAASAAMAADAQFPPEVYGSYAPNGDCSKQPRVNVERSGIHLDTAAGKRGPLPIMVSYSFVGGARYDGIQIWALVKHGGKDRWGDDKQPVLLTFNAGERQGALTAERIDSSVALDGPLSSIVQAATFRICRAGSAATSSVPSSQGAGAANAVAHSPAAGFAAVIGALMQPVSAPEGTYYDWRFIEKAPHITWAALPPEMLDKPLADGHFFRRNGSVSLGGASLKIMAAGARTMVFNHYFKNEGPALGEQPVLSALRASGLTVTLARCPINSNLVAPRWYRISGGGKRPALLWIAQPRGRASPWEGFNLSLDASLKPLTMQERMVYTDRCNT